MPMKISSTPDVDSLNIQNQSAKIMPAILKEELNSQ